MGGCSTGAALIGKIEGLDQKELSTSELLSKVKPYVWPRGPAKEAKSIKKAVVKTVFMIIATKVLGLWVPIIYKDMVDVLVSIENGNKTAADLTAILIPLGSYAAIYLAEPCMDQYKSYTFAKVKQRTTRMIGASLIEKLFALDHRFHSNRETGALLKAVDRGNRAIATVLHAICIVFAPAVFQVLITGGSIWYFCGWPYALALFISALIYAKFSIAFTDYRTPFRIEMNKADMEAGNLATDSLLNYETVKFFANEKFEVDRYDSKLAKYEKSALKTDRTLAQLNLGQQMILGLCLMINLGMAGYGILNAQLTVGDFVMIGSYFQMIQKPLFFLGSTYRDLVQARTDFKTMWHLMDEDSEMEEGKLILRQDAAFNVKFDDIHFGYNEFDVLKGVNFEIAVGERVAIVGGSGAGKSTLVKLLFRFYDPKKGAIAIGGTNIRDCTLNSARKLIGVVPQDCVLFNDTIYNNIRYGRLDATRDEIIHAAKVADLHNAVVGMKDGYATIVGERGVKLSGGEKQRLAIARCFLKNPNIVVYDEATSSLDSLTEQRILESLEEATKTKSLFVIAHRLSTIVGCDKILVLKDGKIVETGTHEELISLKGEYRTMWDIQSAESYCDNAKTACKEEDVETKREKIKKANMTEAKSCCGGPC